ncbi:MAG: pyridoxamine 5'-phosphate oxidase family protein [Acidimicrobiia bacterium]
MSEIPPVYRTPHELDADLRKQLLARSNAVLATINSDGSPHLTELLFYVDDEDRILLPTPHATRKAKNVLARPTVTVFVSVASGWASCTGTARVISGEEAAQLNHLKDLSTEG